MSSQVECFDEQQLCNVHDRARMRVNMRKLSEYNKTFKVIHDNYRCDLCKEYSKFSRFTANGEEQLCELHELARVAFLKEKHPNKKVYLDEYTIPKEEQALVGNTTVRKTDSVKK